MRGKAFLTEFAIGLLVTVMPLLWMHDHAAASPRDYLTESQAERDARMAWWRQARFGMFIHWGLYAVPAGEYRGQRVKGIGEWIQAALNIPTDAYEKLAPQFNPLQYDPDEWVRLAKSAGMKYLVITSKHHDGFGLWDSEVTTWDVADAAPYGKDLLMPLAEACKKYGVKLCFYHSILDWHHPTQYVDPDAKNPRDGHARNRIYPDKKTDYIQFMKTQLKELITRYDPGVLWFDGEWVSWWTEKDGKDLYNYVRSLKEDIIINNRVGKGRQGMQGLNKGPGYAGDFGTPEQEIPDTGVPGVDWESCMTMNDTWGYKFFDDNWKSTNTLIHNIIDTASKGGNYLLNIGPTAEGVFPEESIVRLLEIGEWMAANGEAIYGSMASPFAQPEWGRYTRKTGLLYAHIFTWPKISKLQIPVLQDEVRKVYFLSDKAQKEVGFTQAEDSVTITLPASAPHKIVSVVVLEFVEGK
jgi:alpha-L-fucosidase